MAIDQKKMLVAASIAGLLAAAASIQAPVAQAAGENAACYGINACKGAGACGGQGHSCAGQNACKGAGFLEVPKDLCTKIAGGRLTEAV